MSIPSLRAIAVYAAFAINYKSAFWMIQQSGEYGRFVTGTLVGDQRQRLRGLGASQHHPLCANQNHSAVRVRNAAHQRRVDAGLELGPREIGRASCRESVCQYV